MPLTTERTITINIQPVNDVPNATGAGTSDSLNPDEAYAVGDTDIDGDQLIDPVITYTLREDNSGTTQPFFVPLMATTTPGYNRIGLLDVFDVGPANESSSSPGGSQTLSLVAPSSATSTLRGGTLTPVLVGGTLTGFDYVPPADFNFSFGGVDSFAYEVSDDGTSYSPNSGLLVPDPRSRTNRVEFVLNAVNDAPVFTTTTAEVVVLEDGGAIDYANYAIDVGGGPRGSALDENDTQSLATLSFTITPLDLDVADLETVFESPPVIDSETGELSFRTKTNVFGSYRFEVQLHDGGADDPIRGDVNTSATQILTIEARPINDPPILDPSAAASVHAAGRGFSRDFDQWCRWGSGITGRFRAGPLTPFADESAVITPGGNQTVSLGTAIPTTTANGGTLQLLTTGGPPRLLYTPRENFSGADSFVYSVTDNGQSVNINGVPFDDPRVTVNTVTLNVTPVNDAPLFGIATAVNSSEDDGPVTVAGWATNVQAGPTTAEDEVSGLNRQGLSFVFSQTGGNQDLIVPGSLAATIDPVSGLAALSYEAAADQNGSATFEVSLEDDGPNDPVNGDQNVSAARTFTINVQAVNDPASFSFVSSDPVTLAEDSGPFSTVLLQNISPGPDDENGQTVSFEIQPLAPQFASLFSNLPTIDAAGVLRFTTALNRNTDNVLGPVPVQFLARDSAGSQTGLFGFQIKVTEVNDRPVANVDSIDTNEDTVTTISIASLLANDVDPDLNSNVNETLTIRLPQPPRTSSGALLSYNDQAGQIIYDPTAAASIQSLTPGQRQTDSFAYSLIDAAGLISNSVTVSIHVDGINDAPMLVLDTPQLEPIGSTVIRVLDNDMDIDGTIDPSSVLISALPAFGNAFVNQAGEIVYTPFGPFSGIDTFSYTAADNLGLRGGPATITISANASPIVRNDAAGTFLAEAIRINVAQNDQDSDGLNLASVVIVKHPSHGQAIPQSDGTVLYVPNPDFTGNDSFTYRISDQLGRASDIATVTTRVVASRLQNPTVSADVNGDGHVTAIDALLIINHLNRMGNVSQIPVAESDRGPNYYDVSGDRVITAVDALRVVNALRIQNLATEAEQASPQVAVIATRSERSASIIDAVVADLAGPDKIANFGNATPSSYNSIDTINRPLSSEDDSDAVEAAIDAVMADLL